MEEWKMDQFVRLAAELWKDNKGTMINANIQERKIFQSPR